MPWLSRMSTLARNLLGRAPMDRELDEEVRAYVDLLTEENIRTGMGVEDAHRAALIEVGGVEQVKEQVREVRTGALLDTIVQDLRYAVRRLARSPGFTAVTVIALALGIGANAAIFSVVNAVLLRPLPYANADRLVVILHHGNGPVAPANFIDWRRQSHAFERMGAAEYWTPTVTGGDAPAKLLALRTTSSVLPMLGVPPLLGRVFLPTEDVPGAEHEVVISYGLWQSRFAGRTTIIGQPMMLDGEPYTIVGVMPRGFRFAPFWATKAELWAPLALGDRATLRSANSLRVFARLAPGVTLTQARAEMATITGRLEKEYPGTNRDVTVLSLKEKVVGDIRPALLVLLGGVGFVLLIACANVAHMLLARAAARHKEIALRAALGATRARIIRQFLIESLVLAFAGGGAGLLLAVLGMRVLVALGPASVPRVDTIGLDGRVLGFTLLVSLLTGVIFGLMPALSTSVLDLSGTLKEGERGSTEGIRRNRLRSLLVASEFALAVVLLVGAGLMIRSVLALQAIDPGFNPHNVLSMVVSVTGSREAEPDQRAVFFQRLLQRVRSLPGVQSASAINHLPLAGDLWRLHFTIEGRPIPQPGDVPSATYRVVLPGYFHTMEIPVLQGRDIAESDNLHSPGVAVVNEWMATHYWPGENPLGKRISMGDPRQASSWLTVIGVVKNAVQGDWAAPPEAEVYVPYLQSHAYLDYPASPFAYLTLVVRAACSRRDAGTRSAGDRSSSACDPAALAPAVRNVIWSFDKNLPVSAVQTMDQVVESSTAQPTFYLLLLGTFAVVALALAAVGIYGVMSYSVSRRAHEIGLRMALGAKEGDVLKLVVGQAMLLALAGAGAGLIGALALTRLMSGLLYGVRSDDPATFLAVSLVLSGVALAASYIPARRAIRIDPLVALRHD